MKKSRFVMMLLALFVSMASYAQSISGTVTDDQGEPVIGASVVEKGKPQNGTITDFDGKFTIKVSAGTPIIISYVGYVTQEVKAANDMKVTIKAGQFRAPIPFRMIQNSHLRHRLAAGKQAAHPLHIGHQLCKGRKLGVFSMGIEVGRTVGIGKCLG